MTMMLGKRKRRDQIAEQDTKQALRDIEDDKQQYQILLRKHFETSFRPLEYTHAKPTAKAPLDVSCEEDRSSSPSSGFEWEGLSDENTSPHADIVVHHASTRQGRDEVPHEELKFFMVTYPKGSTWA